MSYVSLSHEAPLQVLRDHPEAVLELLRIAGRDFTTDDVAASVLDTELTEAIPSARRADLVVLLHDANHESVRVVIVEVQRRRDDAKLFAWPLYVAYLYAHHRLPVTLLVLTTDSAIATWARERREIGSNMLFAPWALSPDDLPEMTSLEEAMVRPDMSVLTALARAGDRERAETAREPAEVARVFEAILRTAPSARRSTYLSLLHGTSSSVLRGTLEKLMAAYGMGALEMIFNDGKTEGKAEGKAEGEAARRQLEAPRARSQRATATASRRIVDAQSRSACRRDEAVTPLDA